MNNAALNYADNNYVRIDIGAFAIATSETSAMAMTSLVSNLITVNASYNTMSIELNEGTFKAGTIVASDFAFVGTNAASYAAATTVTRISDKIVILSGIGPLLSASDDRVIVKTATRSLETLNVSVKVSDNYFQYSGDTITGYDANGGTTVIVIPSSLGGTPITKIGDGAFFSCPITNVTIPEGITSIGGSAFTYTNLAEIIIPSTVTNIDTWAFANNSLLTSVRFQCGTSPTIGYSILRDNPLLATIIMDYPGLAIPDRFVTFFDNTVFCTAYEAGGAGTYNYNSADGSWQKQE